MQQNQSHRYSTQHGLFVIRHGFIWAVMLLLSSLMMTSAVAKLCHDEIQSYAIAKNSNVTGQAKPSEDWITINKLPDYWNTRWPSFEHSAWYKIEWMHTCPPNLVRLQPTSIMLENLNLAGQVYVNGGLIWQSRHLESPTSRHLHAPLKFDLPSQHIQSGLNTLLIHVYATPTQQAGIGNIHIGEQNTLSEKFDQLLFEKRNMSFFSIAVNLVIAIFCVLIWLFNRGYKSFLWFAMSSGLWAGYVGLATLIEPWRFLSNLLIDQITMICFCWFVYFCCLSIWHFIHKHYPRIEKSLFIFFSLCTVAIIVCPISYQPILQKSIFISAFAIYIAKAITYPIVMYGTPHKEAYFIALNQMIFLVVGIHDTHYMLTQEGKAWSPYTLALSGLCVGFILALRLSRNTKKVQRFNATLTKSIAEAKAELTTALNQQHQLNLENAKLQERIQLSHDLHDGLGSSIVRSLTSLEHNQMNQQQMTSILKLLRNDLRQVIDTGSSAGAQTPETPVLWVANLRRRYIEIFDDLDIESTWHIPQTWNTLPSPLVCLTLARITEEALTNVLKHSHATKILIQLEQNEQGLTLLVEDNGVGFNQESVEDHFHVGLISMRSRALRLGGQLSIQSTHGCTKINVFLPLTPLNNENEAVKPTTTAIAH